MNLGAYYTNCSRDQKYCCVSMLYKVTNGSCSGGSATNGGYTFASAGGGDIPAGNISINILGKTNPIMRQFDDNFKYTDGSYDYVLYVCGTEKDPDPNGRACEGMNCALC